MSLSESADLHSVPAVSIMSSTMMQCLPLISPTIFIASTSPADRLCLMVIASEMFCKRRQAHLALLQVGECTAHGRITWTFIALRDSMKSLALATPPASGDTIAIGESPYVGTISLIKYGTCSTNACTAQRDRVSSDAWLRRNRRERGSIPQAEVWARG